jgi:hypothetical protein
MTRKLRGARKKPVEPCGPGLRRTCEYLGLTGGQSDCAAAAVMMVIQQVIVMSNQPLVQSGPAAGPPNEAEYNAVYTAVTATERGRWFLAEYANRNRCADTELVIAAIARIEAAIRTDTAPQLSTTLSRELAAAAVTIAPARAGAGERDEDAAIARRPSPPGNAVAAEAQKDRDYSEAVAAIAASLTARVGELVERVTKDLPAHLPVDVPQEPEREPDASKSDASKSDTSRSDTMENALSEVAIRQPNDEKAAVPQQRVPQDNAPRWHIDAPDFVFDCSGRDAKNGGAEPAGETALSHSQLLGAALLSADKAAGSFEGPMRAALEPAIELAVEPSVEPVSAAVAVMPAAEPPIPSISPPAEIVPLPEISRPQLRIANDPAPVNQHPRRYDSLTVTDALSEDEVIALFG